MNNTTEKLTNADGFGSFHRWRVRKELPDGFYTSCEFNSRVPVTAESVLKSPAAKEWLSADKLDEIYHPEP